MDWLGSSLAAKQASSCIVQAGCIANPEVEQWTARLFIKLPTSYPTSYQYGIIHVADRQYVEQWMARQS